MTSTSSSNATGNTRIDADLLDRAVQQALIDFYSRTELINAAIAAEQTHRAHGNHRHQTELHTITGNIATTEKAIDRYLSAFENGTLDERACGHRIRDLTIKLDQLRNRRDELNQLTGSHQPHPAHKPSNACATTSPTS
jgi:site-specific DNA recombinase